MLDSSSCGETSTTKTMATSQQVIHSLKIERLKGISGLEEIRFDEKPLTAILGPNGCGKSTILHALACCFQPPEGSAQPNWRFKDFFTPTSDATWARSSLILTHSFREAAVVSQNVETSYKKDADRWVPRYDRRPSRPLLFIGIKTCVPSIEEETYSNLIRYVTAPHGQSALIMEKMSQVFNRRYVEINIHVAALGREYNGLMLHGGARYSSLAMGAGEQRVLHILLNVFTAPRYALILIDEIDLLLHTAALKELLRILHERAAREHLQIVFTTHREVVLELTQYISIKHLHTVGGRTYCFSNTKPDAMQRLTGAPHRSLEVFVEDEMARAIVGELLISLQMKRFATITPYGAATNCFTLAAGLLLSGNYNFQRQLFVLDGDLYVTPDDRQTRVNSALSGTEADAVERRREILGAIRMFRPIAGIALDPEAQLHHMIRTLPGPFNNDEAEVVYVANQIEAVDDNHSFIGKITETLNFDRNVGLALIVKTASRSPQWAEYVAEVSNWLLAVRADYVEATA